MKKEKRVNIQLKKALALLIAAVMMLSLPSCGAKKNNSSDESSTQSIQIIPDTQQQEQTPSETTESNESPDETETPSTTHVQEDTKVPDESIDRIPVGTDPLWTALPLTSKAQTAAGIAGGEGCQWPLFITFSELDGNLAFMGIDVGGIYRSTDGGKSWKQSSIGLGSEGATAITVDPNNGKRILVCGVNSGNSPHNGLYLSEDAGITWAPVNTNGGVKGHRDYRDAIAFDKTSNSPSVGGSAIAYWLTEWGDLYKTTDGCKTWSKITSSGDFSQGEIFVNPSNGYVYIASPKGFFRSVDRGANFEKRLDVPLTGIDIISSNPNNVYLCGADGIFVSTDSGDTFENVKGSNYPSCAYRIEVSPADPDYMVVSNDQLKVNNSYTNKIFFSHDGGKSWTTASRDTSDSIIPFNVRSEVMSWHPTDKNVCISTGGDMAMLSTDGGQTFKWSNSGNNGAACTNLSINVNDPDLMYASNQDYSGFYTTDGGKTWEYIKWYANWGGFTYGGYALDENHVVAINKVDGAYYIYYTADGGKTVKNTNVTVDKNFRCVTGVPGDENIVLCNAYRSIDKGITWEKMDGCVAVFDSNPQNGYLYGINEKSQPVVSTDKGITWSRIGNYSKGVKDMEYDASGNRLIILSGNKIIYGLGCDDGKVTTIKDFSLMKDGFGGELMIRCIEVDPENSNRIYAGNARHTYASDVGVLFTEDGGKTWSNLTSTRDNIYPGDNGGREVNHLAINPETRTLFAVGMCRGIYKMTLPTK